LLDLLLAFDVAYSRAGFGQRIDYGQALPGTWSREIACKVSRFLHEIGFRFDPPEDEVAVAAYFRWQQAGCPSACAEQHWEEAREELRARWSSRRP
jgi:hypothetical protein